VSTFLSDADVATLTGRKQPAAQRRWLARNGLRFFVRADGRPAVPADQVGSTDPRPMVAKWEPFVAESGLTLPEAPVEPLSMADILRLPQWSQARNDPGLYFLFRGGELVYVGRSVHVRERLAQHLRSSKDWDGARVRHCSPRRLEDAELAHIRKFRPSLNLRDKP
jgi:hypothetical protein